MWDSFHTVLCALVINERQRGEIDELEKLNVLDELLTLSSKKGIIDTVDLPISNFIRQFAEILPKQIDNVSEYVKQLEKEILKEAGKIKISSDQLEYGCVVNRRGLSTGVFTSGKKGEINPFDSFRNKKETRANRKELKGATVSHNHPNFTRFSNEDIAFFLYYELKELRAINDKGIVYSLKLKPGQRIFKADLDNMEKYLDRKTDSFWQKISGEDDFFGITDSHRELLEDL